VDGGTIGQLGAKRLAEHPPSGVRPVAAIALDGVGLGDEPLPILFAGNDGRRSAAGLPRAAIQALETGGVPAQPPDVGEQVLELLQPAAAEGAQAPFVDHDISAIQIGDGNDATGPVRITRQQLERVGLALDTLVQRLDTTPESVGKRQPIQGHRRIASRRSPRRPSSVPRPSRRPERQRIRRCVTTSR